MDKNKDVYLHRQRRHESGEALVLNRGLGASRLTTDHLVDGIAAGWMGRAQVPFSVGETYRFSLVFIGDSSPAKSCSASPIIFGGRLARNVQCRLALLSLECDGAL
jgi:hypothetical protein